MQNYKNEFLKKGFFKITKFIDSFEMPKILNEINKSKNKNIYKDRNNKIRRIEHFYKDSFYLQNLNIKFIKLIKKTINEDFLIFKDKFNLKPAGGEGFYAHYDGVFKFIDSKNKEKNGWYEYGNYFVNCLLAIDKCSEENGTIELSNSHNENFENLLKNTKCDGTPNLLEKIEKNIFFKKINLDPGDVVIFKNTCPHRSDKNKSKLDRRILYFTYLSKEYGNQYEKYFKDKINTKNNSSKSLSGNI